jgi:hypothetical protein
MRSIWNPKVLQTLGGGKRSATTGMKVADKMPTPKESKQRPQ